MGESGDQPDATRSLARAVSTGHTAATAVLSDPGSPSPPSAEVATGTSDPAPDHDVLPVGSKLGRFSVLGKLGAGGMGVVYAAYDPELDRRVAVKVLGSRERSREANLRLLREAQAMARLSHPNVVSVYDVGELDGRTVFLAMEFVDGQTLKPWLEARSRSWHELRDILVQAGRGLAAAHRSGLVHRDFKPSNLLIDGDDRVKVSDFGIARLDDTDDAAIDARVAVGSASGITPLAIELTRTGTAIGTPAYMAPEQHRGTPVDARADQFAFCVTAWEAVYGERPFAGKGAELVRAIEAGPPRPARTARDVPPWLAAALGRGLALAPADRWPSLDALLDRLAFDPAARRRRRLAIAAGLIVVAAAAAGISYLASHRDRDVCGAGDRELATTWNPNIRAAAETAFRATGSPLATDHWALVSGRVDTWAHQWTAARRDACEQHAGHAQSDDLFDRRVACLARGRARVAALADLLRTADAAIVRESVMAAALLPPPEDCADVEALLDQRPLPADPAVRESVAGYRAELERANAERTVGRYQEALDLVTGLRDRAKGVDYQLLQAELVYSVGLLQTDVSDAAAEATLRQAADAAASARDTELYARVWMSLVWEIGAKRARFDDAAPARTIAWQAVHLAGDDAYLVSAMEMNAAAVDLVHGDHPSAIVALEQAIAITETIKGAHSIDLVAPLNLLAVSMADKQPDQAIVVYQRALAVLSETVSPRHPRAGSILGNLGNIAFDQGRIDDAIDLDRRALDIEQTALGPDSSDLGPSLNGLAQPLWALGKWDEAYELIDRARILWEKALGPDHPYVAIAYTNLGGLRQEQGRCADGLPLLAKARAIQTKVYGAEDPAQAMTLTFTGGCLNDLGRSAEAMPVLELALKLYTQSGRPIDQAAPSFELARAMWATNHDRAKALQLAEAAHATLLADKGDQAIRAAGANSGSAEIAAWLVGKSAPLR